MRIFRLALAFLIYGGGETSAQEAPKSRSTTAQTVPAARHPDKENTYTITSVLQVLNPVRPADMADDFQDVRVLAQDRDSTTVEITYYPLYQPVMGENPHWRRDYAGMTEYLQPGLAANWDPQMQKDLLAELRRANIDPDQLTDRELVRQVSGWAMKRATSTNAFAIWCVEFREGQPTVYPDLRRAFDRAKPDASWTDQRMFEQEVLGRSLFYNKIHGSCTSSAVYMSTILRALGIPTRLVFCIPPFDPNDAGQAERFYGAVHHHATRETVRAALDGMTGFDNHVFNEVFVDHRWVRLNYSTLGQPILDRKYFGLLTHIFTCSDLSDVSLPSTWGMRYFNYPAGQPKLSSVNPYRLISVEDHFGGKARVDNPPAPLAELRTATIVGLYFMDSPNLPGWVDKKLLERSQIDFVIAIREWIPDVDGLMRAFEKRSGHDFILSARGSPEVALQLSGLRLSSGDGTFQAFGARLAPADRAKLTRGIDYTIRPVNTNETYRWEVARELAPFRWQPASPSPANAGTTGEPPSTTAASSNQRQATQAGELKSVTIAGVFLQESPAVPAWVDRQLLIRSGTDFVIAIREWVPGRDHVQLREFAERVSHDFLLSAPKHPDVRVKLAGPRFSAGDGSFQAFSAQVVPADRGKLARGVDYSLRPINTSASYRWEVAPDFAPLRWEVLSP